MANTHSRIVIVVTHWKQQSAGRPVASFEHIVLIPIQPVFIGLLEPLSII
jgi:hypothetical protein